MDYSKIKKLVYDMSDANGYSLRDAPVQGDDFRIFLTPQGGSTETVEVFKEKRSDSICCGAGLIMGGTITGEHGDGLARSEYIKKQYGSTNYKIFRVKKTV